MSIEKELLEVTGFTPKRKYPDRQDYLAALARAVNQVEDEDFDKLSEGAVDWFNAAAKAIGNKRDIEDFESFPNDERPGDVSLDEDEETDTLEEEMAEAEVVEEEPEEKPKKASKLKQTKDARLIGVSNRASPPPKKLKALPVKERKKDEPIDVELDKFACIPGTKNAAAADLFEKGARMSDVTKTLGGTYYNLLARLVKQGHKVEKGLHGIILLTHNSDVVVPKSKYAPKDE